MNPLILESNTISDSKIIVALDYNNKNDVIALVSKLSPELCRLKVGKELFTSCGPDIVRYLTYQGYDVFLDLKFHDIPNTVYSAVKTSCDLGVWMVNIHIAGGVKMMQKAVEAAAAYNTLLIGVTILTSLSQDEYLTLGYKEESLHAKVLSMAKLAYEGGVDGVVCSALEVPSIKVSSGNEFLCVTPGIRLLGDNSDDQSRVMTPEQAVLSGADYLVMGRSITKSKDPQFVLSSINRTLANSQ